uniref:dITP/XTP pyrophosphatase n=1 Tax=Candidatus Kentrum sp. MB TaxID=2138164 RepID=A0A450X3C8_9GAMM|nr:MAG: XTP/dITP diphosphohydrolase [Candidatus Kentron sp. MB]VFK26688.1 MAG: XTP/dITP diphosphohydrolase [Candidatus Kentron sp. MB]VFK74598.1 MAG: XTP/dITP diphosphohydrolase [Candidatus Kentron sp. MB]
MKKIVLASSNPGKLRELGELLAPLEITLTPQSDFGIQDVEETGKTFIENAILKARHAAAASGLPAIADDSGLVVDYLGGAPGIYSARYAGEGASDQKNLERLLDALAEVPESKRGAQFKCLMVYLRHADDPTPLIADGAWDGHILFAPRGDNGFGYDPIFHVPTHNCSSAELPSPVKNALSHRGQAVHKLIALLSQNP